MGLFKRSKSATSHDSSPASPSSSGSQTPELPQITRQLSFSNLSTSSTLLNFSTPKHPSPNSTSYEMFQQQARIENDRQRRIEHAWLEAARRRMAQGQHWPHDPWRGGFGPPAHASQAQRFEREVARDLVEAPTPPERNTARSRAGMGGNRVGQWLKANGLA